MTWPSGTAPGISCCGSPDPVPETHEQLVGERRIAQYVTQYYPFRTSSTVKALFIHELKSVMNVFKVCTCVNLYPYLIEFTMLFNDAMVQLIYYANMQNKPQSQNIING